MPRSDDAPDPSADGGAAGRRARRPRLWPELLLIAICYACYSMVRNLVPADHATAAHRAQEILALEYQLNLDIEYALNRLFVDNAWLAIPANYFYATMHFAVTIGVLVWLYVRHPDRYTTYRTVLFATTMVGLVGFWLYPLAPPRMLPGFTDTVISFGTWGIYGSSPMASMSNQYAAMPSMHTAWALWCAVAVIGVAGRRRPWTMPAAALYPTVTVFVIMGTANHFLLDAVGGAAALACGFALRHGAFRAFSVVLPARAGSQSSTP